MDIDQCSERLHITFQRRDKESYRRDEWLFYIIRIVGLFINSGVHTIEELLLEACKNIWDHADAQGSVTLTKLSNGAFTFIVTDGHDEPFVFDVCEGNSRLAGNGTNFGEGLGIIRRCMELNCAHATIDTTQGFRYEGIFFPGVVYIDGQPISR